MDGTASNPPGIWQRWLRQPQSIWLRKAFFQIHLWSGIALGLYVLIISVTGSILVYRNELYVAATRKPIVSTSSSPRLTDEQLSAAAQRVYSGYQVQSISRGRTPDEAVDVWLRRGDDVKKRLFDPRTGADLGDSVPTGIRLVSQLLDLHDNLFAGPIGREVNGAAAIAVVVLALSGFVVWWPGIRAWRRSLTLHRGVGWKRLMWDLHSMLGFWSLAFILLFALTGIYLGFPEAIEDFALRLEPVIGSTDRLFYWSAILHAGRINGIGFPCGGPGFCDQGIKAIWAFFGLAPAAMFVTGGIMWWNRVLRPRWVAVARPSGSRAVAAS